MVITCPGCGREQELDLAKLADMDSPPKCEACGAALVKAVERHEQVFTVQAPGARPAKWRRAGTAGLLGVVLVAALFLGIMGGVAVGAGAPGVQKLVAPLVCEPGYKDAVVVVEKTNPKPGETVMTSEFYCIDAQDKPYYVGTFKVMVLLAAGLSGTFFVLGLVAVALLSLTRRGSPATQGPSGFDSSKPIG